MAITKFKASQFKINSIDLTTKVYNFLPVSRLNSGTNATSYTYFRGDNTWNIPVDYPSRDKINFELSASDIGGAAVGGEFTVDGGSAVGTVTTVLNSLGTWNNYLSVATINLTQGLMTSTGYAQCTSQQGIVFSSTVMFPNASDLTNVRIWAGMFGADPTASDNPNAILMAFRYSTASDGTAFWRTTTRDLSTINALSTTVAITSGVKYNLEIDARDLNNIKFYINSILVNTHTTNQPFSTGLLGFVVKSTNLTATAHNIRWYKTQLEFQ